MTAVLDKLPTTITRTTRGLAIASLVSQILIVGTGGAVRLTDSGLGCPTWPECTEGSLIAVPEMGIHGAIEFGNRLLTFVLVVIALAMFLAVIRLRRERPELVGLSIALGAGIIAQAVIGGISVLTNLNPWVVGLHFVVSALLVSLATVLLYRVVDGPQRTRVTVPRWYLIVTAATGVLVGLTILAGIVTTGSGPHAGDHGAARNGLDSEFLQHVHSWPAYAMLLGVVVLLVSAWRLRLLRGRLFALLLLAVSAAQIIVGLAQARLGLPEVLVGTHMVLACCLASAYTALALSVREPRPEGATGIAEAGSDTERVG